MPYSVLIIGAGQIAAGFDDTNSQAVLTHAHALTDNANFELLGFYDTDKAKAESAAAKWGVKAFDEIAGADMYVICSPDRFHLESVKAATEHHPKLIVLEKPIADKLTDAKRILDIAENAPIQVNFTRRFVPEFQELAKKVSDFGKFLTGTGLYGKGFIHNGSHMLDLLRLLLGDISTVDVLSEISDYNGSDKTKTAIIDFQNGGRFFMRGLDCSYYTVFEFELCFEKARVKILDGGYKIQIEKVKPSEKFAGYRNLALSEEYPTSMDKAMTNLYQNAYEYLSCGKKLTAPVEAVFCEELYI